MLKLNSLVPMSLSDLYLKQQRKQPQKHRGKKIPRVVLTKSCFQSEHPLIHQDNNLIIIITEHAYNNTTLL